MFLSDAQLYLISELNVNNALDIMHCNINTVSALNVRGITMTEYATKVGEVTTVKLTDVGERIASHIGWYADPPKFADIRYKTSKIKQKHKKWVEKHAKKVA